MELNLIARVNGYCRLKCRCELSGFALAVVIGPLNLNVVRAEAEKIWDIVGMPCPLAGVGSESLNGGACAWIDAVE
jgi:hypothetical protein